MVEADAETIDVVDAVIDTEAETVDFVGAVIDVDAETVDAVDTGKKPAERHLLNVVVVGEEWVTVRRSQLEDQASSSGTTTALKGAAQ